MHKEIPVFLLAIILLASCDQKKVNVPINEVSVEAPFEMPMIKVPDFSDIQRFVITDFGAEEDDQQATSQAIVTAISAAVEAGGGRIVIPAGEWPTGKIHLKSNINIHLEEGATLLFSEDPKDYLPAVKTTWEGMECFNYSPLIYAFDCENIAITGKGELKAKMNTWKVWFSRPKAHMESLKRLYNLAATDVPVEERNFVNDSSNFRPQFIQFNRCEKVLLEGVKITNSPFWVIHPFMSKDVVIRDVQVFAHGHNNDGVDPEMSQNMLIENCIFDQGDDAIAVKSGRNQDAWRLNMPTKNIVIRNSLVKNGHQLLAIGSELSGGVENVYMENCEVQEGAKLNHLLYVKTNERRGGYVRNVHMKNIQCGKIDKGVLGIETDVLYQWRDLVPTYERRLTPIENIYMENVRAADVAFVSRIKADPESPVEVVQLKNIQVESIRDQKVINENVNGFQMKD
ncbi:glycoside hydrolase family 28 protein [Echinicola vietnamensis]|uniref:Endopolygalacturonase n=1 Tax=Echinicola vietnamensis (strain DSM 17526 / LMG 23754 / KMM 6221) TaxID=926556 RepID=L0FVH6_ECHVK|nr:glycoside hydrolase family 28 protein [Echinicola vietnamensis]AGA77904.1 endopolygalacturonase [Echinicola vietnamensis DSM 17526]